MRAHDDLHVALCSGVCHAPHPGLCQLCEHARTTTLVGVQTRAYTLAQLGCPHGRGMAPAAGPRPDTGDSSGRRARWRRAEHCTTGRLQKCSSLPAQQQRACERLGVTGAVTVIVGVCRLSRWDVDPHTIVVRVVDARRCLSRLCGVASTAPRMVAPHRIVSVVARRPQHRRRGMSQPGGRHAGPGIVSVCARRVAMVCAVVRCAAAAQCCGVGAVQCVV